jgi:hypothetical protein
MEEPLTPIADSSNSQQLSRLHRRLNRCLDDLNKIAERLPSSLPPASRVGGDVDRRQLERDCICLEVSLDEASKWARAILQRIEAAPVEHPPATSSITALLKIEQLLGKIPVAP